MKYGHFWFKLTFQIMKMSEMNSASLITPKTMPLLSKSTKQLLKYCPYMRLMLIQANNANYANCQTYAS